MKRQKNLASETEKSVNKIRKLEAQLKDAQNHSFSPEFDLNQSTPNNIDSSFHTEGDENDLRVGFSMMSAGNNSMDFADSSRLAGEVEDLKFKQKKSDEVLEFYKKVLQEEMDKSKGLNQRLLELEDGEERELRILNMKDMIQNLTHQVEEKDMELNALKDINRHLQKGFQ